MAGFFCRFLDLGAEGVFVEPNYWRPARLVINGEDVKAERTFGYVSLRKKMDCGASEEMLFSCSNAELRQSRKIVAERASADLNEGERLAVIADHVELAFGGTRREIARDENVAVAAEVPVSVSFAANASSTSSRLSSFRRRRVFVAETLAGGPVDNLEDQARNDWHGSDEVNTNS